MSGNTRERVDGRVQPQRQSANRAAQQRGDRANQEYAPQYLPKSESGQRAQLTTIGSNEALINTPLLAVTIPRIVGEDRISDNKVITNCIKALGLSENAATLDQFLTAFVRIFTPVAGREATIAFFEQKYDDPIIVPERFGRFNQEQFFLNLADCMVRAGYPITLLDNAFDKVGVRLAVEGRGVTRMHDARLVEYPSVTLIARIVTHIKLREHAALTSDSLTEFCCGANSAVLSSPTFIRKFARVIKTPGVFNGVEVTDSEIAGALAVISPFTYREILRMLIDTTWNIDTTGNVPTFDLLLEAHHNLARAEVLDNTANFDSVAHRLQLGLIEFIPVYAALNAVRCRLCSPRKGRTERGVISDAYRKALEISLSNSTMSLLVECERIYAERGVWLAGDFKESVYECDKTIRESASEWFPVSA